LRGFRGGGSPAVTQRGPWWIAVLGAALLLGSGLVLGPAVVPSSASSHADAPLVTADPQVDGTDMYAFTSPERPDTVTLVANYLPFQPLGSPMQLAPDARYEFHIDDSGTGRSDITYRLTVKEAGSRLLFPLLASGPVYSLDSPNLQVRQTYTLERLRTGQPTQVLLKDAAVAPPFINGLVMPRYDQLRAQAVHDLPGGGRVFVGSAADPFFVNSHTTALIRFGAAGPPIAIGVPENVQTLALQIPKNELALNGDAARNPVIGAWATASRPTMSLVGGGGGFTQVSRMAVPTFNESYVRCLFPQFLCPANDTYNSSSPADDWTTGDVQEGVLNPQRAAAIKMLTGFGVPNGPREDLKEALLTGFGTAGGGPVKTDLNAQSLNRDADPNAMIPAEEMRLNMSTPVAATPNPMGFLAGDRQGFPNGRRLGDDASAASLALMQGALVDKTIDVDSPLYRAKAPVKPSTNSFPYVATPLTSD
jgi:hypothetical protein